MFEPVIIPPPDVIRNRADIAITFQKEKAKNSKSQKRLEVYKAARNCAEYFQLHPGNSNPDVYGNVSAAADFRNDVQKGIITFDDPQLRERQRTYAMSRGELAELFELCPAERAHASHLARAEVLRAMNWSAGAELDLFAHEVEHVQSLPDLPKVSRKYFESVDVDETVHDSVLYALITDSDIEEFVLSVQFDKHRDAEAFRSRSDDSYTPTADDLVISEDMVVELRGITDPVERRRVT